MIICKKKYHRHIDRAVFPGSQGIPALNQVAAKADCFYLADTPEFAVIQRRTVAIGIHIANELRAVPIDRWVIVDEVQRLPGLLNEVHRFIEEKGLRFVL
ncbi:MAG: hypothetical protein U9Q05_09105, partial [Thermodesulfobacteriota bacterium]|nr:hypothetical protein [Thermodesulfobacteriota bacterium]